MFAVLTGPPCSGKSTTIGMLDAAGCPVMHEIATTVINEGVHQPWLGDSEQLAFQTEVAKRQAFAEAQLDRTNDVVYLDRGRLDPIAYRLIYGRSLTDMHHNLTAERYGVAFVFEPVDDWENNGVRYEDPDFSREMTFVMKRVYESFGVPVATVPNAPRAKRMAFISDTMAKLWTPKSNVKPRLPVHALAEAAA